ncbi:MAG: malto-oligosyltrehalose trehalohydrolase [Gammaproteobacteria bacterium]
MRCAHSMPFGAEISAGGTRFALWAPVAIRVDVEIDGESPRPMERRDDGFHVLTVPNAAAGRRYAYRVDGRRVPDPASRFNPEGVEGPSEIVDPRTFDWHDEPWAGRPWHEAVLYELHVGAFTAEGTFAAAAERLPYLAELGVTAIELMPIADGPGERSWGYDAVLPYAIRPAYGRPPDLKSFVQAAHREGLMVLLDVVYNHFGPAGNYLPLYAPQFFTARHKTPWGDAIDFDGEASPVRAFFIHNALYWLEEYRFDGLRLDAVDAIFDDSEPDFLTELARTVERKITGRPVHLVLENASNEARRLERRGDGVPRTYVAQWNDDFHHAMHVLVTGETSGYYEDFDRPGERLLRCLVEGFAYQGERSRHLRVPRGEPSSHLPPDAFVNFLQNHDQVGNRAFGERLSMLAAPERLRTAETVLLLLPSPILLFMGEEFHAPSPFPYFCDFDGELADAVRDGRRSEFAHFFDGTDELARMPDPNDPRTFELARLDWAARTRGDHAQAAARYAELLAVRRAELMPRLPAGRARGRLLRDRAVEVSWPLADGSTLTLVANLQDRAVGIDAWPRGDTLAATARFDESRPEVPQWFSAWFIERRRGPRDAEYRRDHMEERRR